MPANDIGELPQTTQHPLPHYFREASSRVTTYPRASWFRIAKKAAIFTHATLSQTPGIRLGAEERKEVFEELLLFVRKTNIT